MTNEELQQEFWKFLSRKGLIRKFKKNVKDAIKNNNYGTKFTDTLKENIGQAINYGFIWGNTKERYAFWQKIHTEWRYYIKKIDGRIVICGHSVIFNKKDKRITVGCYTIPWEKVEDVYLTIIELKK